MMNVMTNACVNVLCKMTAGGGGGGGWGEGGGDAALPIANLDEDFNTVSQYVLSSATFIWQCDVVHDEKRMNMIKRDGNDETV